MRVDLHVHSAHSARGGAAPAALASMARARGLDAIALTDPVADGWIEVEDALARERVALVRGQELEVRVEGRRMGELLCLFLRRPLLERELEPLLEEVAAQGGLVSLPHPFEAWRRTYRGFEALLARPFVCIEAGRGRDPHGLEQRLALGFARERGLPVTAGSGARSPLEVGRAGLGARASDLDELKLSILKRRAIVGTAPPEASSW